MRDARHPPGLKGLAVAFLSLNLVMKLLCMFNALETVGIVKSGVKNG